MRFRTASIISLAMILSAATFGAGIRPTNSEEPISHTLLALCSPNCIGGTFNGRLSGFGFGAVEDSPGMVLYQVPRDISLSTMEDLQQSADLVHIAKTAASCNFTSETPTCIVETFMPNIVYRISNVGVEPDLPPTPFVLTFVFVAPAGPTSGSSMPN